MLQSEDFLSPVLGLPLMNHPSIRTLALGRLAMLAAVSFSACTVDENAALLTKNSASGSRAKFQSSSVKTEDKDIPSWSERMAEAKAEREKRAAEAERERQQELAAKKKADDAKARKLAAEKKALAEKKARDEAAREKAKAIELAKKKAEEEKRREAKIAARKKAERERAARQLAEELVQNAEWSQNGGFFSRLNTSHYKSKGHNIYVNRMALSGLSPSNAKIEVDLSEQKARVYKTGGGKKQLVIETQVSTGKSGYTTPTGSYRIQEKRVEKRSTLYGSWHDSSGAAVRSSGEASNPPAGGTRFVGSEMPYWMRVNGGIGMHVGYVPDYPASHGCIRVPSGVQPLIYSKVGLGTQVTITY